MGRLRGASGDNIVGIVEATAILRKVFLALQDIGALFRAGVFSLELP